MESDPTQFASGDDDLDAVEQLRASLASEIRQNQQFDRLKTQETLTNLKLLVELERSGSTIHTRLHSGTLTGQVTQVFTDFCAISSNGGIKTIMRVSAIKSIELVGHIHETMIEQVRTSRITRPLESPSLQVLLSRSCSSSQRINVNFGESVGTLIAISDELLAIEQQNGSAMYTSLTHVESVRLLK